MSRLIDADVIYQWYRDSFDFEPNEVKFSMLDIRNNLENIPTADVPNMTGDLISRQTALSTIEANQGTLNKRKVMKILEGLPSAEKAQLSGEDATFDCISRQDAIDAFWKLDVELRPSAMDAVVDMLKSVPSASTELSNNSPDINVRECPWFDVQNKYGNKARYYREEPQWIPCTPETMPEEGVDVLFMFLKNMAVGSFEDGIWYVNSGGGWYTSCCEGDELPIAWMPLPSPY